MAVFPTVFKAIDLASGTRFQLALGNLGAAICIRIDALARGTDRGCVGIELILAELSAEELMAISAATSEAALALHRRPPPVRPPSRCIGRPSTAWPRTMTEPRGGVA
jgi:hypothetical protein